MKSFITCSAKAIFVLSIFIFSACGSNNREESSPSVRDTAARGESGPSTRDTAATVAKDTSNSAQDFLSLLPSPLLMVKIFKRTGLKYVDGITNSPDNVSKYSSAQNEALNLGVYSSDLAYTVLNKQNQQASRYMESIKRLSDDLGMSSLFAADNYLKRFKNNLDNEDSLIRVVCELKSEMDVFMKDNDKEKQTLLIFIGAWMENMYIATQLTKETQKNKVATRIAEQKHLLNNLMNVSTSFQNDAEFKTLYLKLNELKNLFDNLTVQGEEEKITMDEFQLKAITEKIRNLRKEIVE